MRILWTVLLFIIGSIFGSFFNVVGLRLPKGQSIIYPGSSCPHCKHELRWYELVPIISYLFLGGRCLKCKEKISLIYPLIEFATGLLFAGSYYIFGFTDTFLISILSSSLLMIVFVSDLNYLIIPDEVTLSFSVLVFIVNLITKGISKACISLLSGLFLFLLMYLIMILGQYLLKKECLGGGDVKLMFFVGITLGPILGSFSILLSSIIAFPISLIFYLKDDDNVIPFGPFILLATVIIILLGINEDTIFMIFNIFKN